MSASDEDRVPIAILGGGLMGHGIAQVFAVAGHHVTVYDKDGETLARLPERIVASLTAMGADPKHAKAVEACATLDRAVADAGVVFDAVREHLETKQVLFEAVEQVARPDAVFASNTSVIPITQIMARLRHRERALGTHWWNPPTLVPLVEVVGTQWTDATVVEKTMSLLRSVGKVPVHVRKDIPGFIGNRLQHALWREAIALVEHGVCDAETIDTVVKMSFGRRLGVLGPLENADLVGIDLALAVHDIVFPDLDHSRTGQTLLREMVASGRLGMKTDTGFYDWTESRKQAVRDRLNRALLAISADEAADLSNEPAQ